MKTPVIGKRYHRMVPCPSYEIARMEEWLEDAAAEGFLLEKDGITAGVATFVYQEPQTVKYRLEAAPGRTGMWSPNGGEPDPEQIALGAKYSWEYTAKLPDFYVYRSFDPEAREWNTDPTVQAIALHAVKKRAAGSIVSSILLLVVYPILLTRGCFLMTAITMGSGWMLLDLLLTVILIANEIRTYVHLKRTERTLQNEGCYESENDRKTERIPYTARKLFVLLLGIFLFCTLLRTFGRTVTNVNKIPIGEYGGTIPFATMEDIAGEGYTGYEATMSGLFSGINTIEETSGLLAPRYIDYNEHAAVQRADGAKIDGGLYVTYCELRSPKAARILARELYRLERLKTLKKMFEPMETPELEAEYAVAYRNEVHFPAVILQKGNVVVQAMFFQTGDTQIPLSEWASLLCDSL